jgi:hypothetical protein
VRSLPRNSKKKTPHRSKKQNRHLRGQSDLVASEKNTFWSSLACKLLPNDALIKLNALSLEILEKGA